MRPPHVRAGALAATVTAALAAALVPGAAGAAPASGPTSGPTSGPGHVLAAGDAGAGLPHPAIGQPGGGEPVPADPYDYPPGEVCPFAMHVEFPVNEMRAVTVPRPDGSPLLVRVAGTLVGEYTNTGTGETITRDLSGVGTYHYRPDGSLRLLLDGAGSIGFHTDDDPANLLQVNGEDSVTVLDVAADGHKTRVAQAGPYEDLCATLGD